MTAFFWHERNIGDAAAPPPPLDQGSGEDSQVWATVVQVATQKSEAIAPSSAPTGLRVFIPSNLQSWSCLLLSLGQIMVLVTLSPTWGRLRKCMHLHQTLAIFKIRTASLALRLLLLMPDLAPLPPPPVFFSRLQVCAVLSLILLLLSQQQQQPKRHAPAPSPPR